VRTEYHSIHEPERPTRVHKNTPKGVSHLLRGQDSNLYIKRSTRPEYIQPGTFSWALAHVAFLVFGMPLRRFAVEIVFANVLGMLAAPRTTANAATV
jgi:hypothetical protein